MTCANPIAWATLVDYWAGDLNDAETAVVDERAARPAAVAGSAPAGAEPEEAARR